MFDESSHSADAAGLRIGIAVSRYHSSITDSLKQGAVDAFISSGGDKENLLLISAPGTFELTALCRALAAMESRTCKPRLDAIVALGCIIRGETNHDQYIAQSVTHGLTTITVETGIPIGFGVLTCDNMDQAKARSSSTGDGKNNKGAEAMLAAIHSANTIHSLAKLKDTQ